MLIMIAIAGRSFIQTPRSLFYRKILYSKKLWSHCGGGRIVGMVVFSELRCNWYLSFFVCHVLRLNSTCLVTFWFLYIQCMMEMIKTDAFFSLNTSETRRHIIKFTMHTAKLIVPRVGRKTVVSTLLLHIQLCQCSV